MESPSEVKDYYRISENFTRYFMDSKKRVDETRRLVASKRKYFGKRILDIACGGGILGFILNNRNYVGIDVNPDMIQYAKNYKRKTKSKSNYILGDITKTRIRGKFDTFSFLGNGLAHFTTIDFVDVLKKLNSNFKRNSYFIIEYRDVVDLLFNKQWKDRMIEKDSYRTVVSTTLGSNMKTGEIYKKAFNVNDKSKIEFSHTIWSPFILEAIMRSFDWKLVKREEMKRWNGWIEIYQKS